METVVVTGGAGYIGSHVCRALSEKYNVIVYDNLSKGHRWAVQWGELVEGDVRDYDRLVSLFKKQAVSGVFHFAAVSLVGESVENPLLYWDNNVGGTISLLQAMKEASVPNIVFSSTAAVFGDPDSLPLDENSPLKPCNPYGHTKLAIENVLSQSRAAYGLSYSVLRYFNAAGADPDCDIGEDHSPESHLIPLVLNAASGLRDSISIFGNDYDTEDGTCVRDYIHVTDLAQAHVLAFDRIRDKSVALTLNLGNGSGYSVRQVVDSVKAVTGKDFTVNISPRRAGDPAVLIASSKLAMSELDWRPVFTELDDIVSTAWRWHLKHFIKE